MIPLYNAKRFLRKSLQQPLYALRVLAKRTTAYLSYWAGDGKAAYPESITLFLTHRCNLQCRMCGQWGREGVTKKHDAQYINTELSTDKLKEIINDVSSFRPNITLFGGEPMLYRGSAEIIRHIKDKGMHCLMITNGSLLAEAAKDIVDSGLDELNVSLDGGRELHDEIRGMPGLFDRIMDGLKKVRAIKLETKKKGPLINLQCTITQYNYKHLEQMLDVAKEACVDSLTFHNLIFLSSDALEREKEFDKALGCESAEWQGFKFEPGIDPVVLYDKMEHILSHQYRFNVDFYPNFSREALIEYYTNPGYTVRGYSDRCISPWVAAYIFPDGEVRPCLNSSYSYGNAVRDRFTRLWNNDKAVKFRLFLKGKRTFPACCRCTELYRY